MNEEFKTQLYLDSIHFNVAAAKLYIDYVSSIMSDKSFNGPGHFPMKKDDARLVLDALQQIVIQAGAISRYFWPPEKLARARGERLRMELNIPDDSPLKPRDLRNSMEHFDERLDKFLANWNDGYLQTEYVGPSVPNRAVTMHHFRAYFADITVFELLGERYDIQPLSYAIMDLYKLIDARVKENDRQARLSANTR